MFGIDVTNPFFANLLSRQVAINTNDYGVFIESLYIELIRCFEKLEGNANQHVEKDETGISSEVMMFLEGARYRCSTESNSNGHVDLTVEEGQFKWLGEAKIHKGNEWTFHGFEQLVMNYSTGRPNACHGAIIVYNTKKKKSSMKCAKEWREHIENEPLNVTCSEYQPDGYFDMVLPEHSRSGAPYYIRNFFVTLHYTESDKIGKKPKP